LSPSVAQLPKWLRISDTWVYHLTAEPDRFVMQFMNMIEARLGQPIDTVIL
jgi:hypothetical protein